MTKNKLFFKKKVFFKEKKTFKKFFSKKNK